MSDELLLVKLQQLREDLIVLANDELGMDDYRSQLRRYQVLILGIIDWLIEKENENG